MKYINIKQKIATAAATAAFILATAVFPVAANNNNNGNTFGPYPSTSPDGGSCGAPWANDTFDRVFTVNGGGDNNDGNHQNNGQEQGNNPSPVPTPAGTYRVREDFVNGKFLTTGPVSPGACETTDTQHGTAVLPGIQGKFGGYLEGNVTGGTYNPNGCNANPAACNTTAGFITTTFGPTAVYTTDKFDFQYRSNDPRLIYKYWRDQGSATTEIFTGDIATQ